MELVVLDLVPKPVDLLQGDLTTRLVVFFFSTMVVALIGWIVKQMKELGIQVKEVETQINTKFQETNKEFYAARDDIFDRIAEVKSSIFTRIDELKEVVFKVKRDQAVMSKELEQVNDRVKQLEKRVYKNSDNDRDEQN